MSDAYAQFLASKAINDPMTGLIDLPDLPDCLFPHQRDIVKWALRRGRAALLAGTGLGKSLMELAWGDAIAKSTGGMVILFAPLAVAAQMLREAAKFGIPARIVTCQAECGPGINITNYQKMEHFDLSLFIAVILDESSLLKSVDGHYRTALIAACQSIPFRLAATATPAPNDFMELGNHAEFLGVMSYTDMLATFFVHDGGDTQKWRLKGHAENEFWKWMTSWAVMLQKPSDLGYPNDGYDLPPLHFVEHRVSVDYAPSLDTGMLFPIQAETLQERISARRATVDKRCNLAFGVVISSFCDKFPEWKNETNHDGSLNIRKIAKLASRLILNMQNDMQSSKSVVGEHQRKTANTCAPITRLINIGGTSGRANSKTKSTVSGGKNTPRMINTENNKKPQCEEDAQLLENADASNLNMVLHLSNMTKCSGSKAGDARYVEQDAQVLDLQTNSALITATNAVTSEASCAAIATSPLGYSETAATYSAEQSNISTLPLEPWVIWCHLNSEQEILKREFGDLAISIHGGNTEEEKEYMHHQWMAGVAPVLLVKPSMFGHGLNWQHCNKTLFVGLNDSFEQFYQAVRRFWRFGQIKPVTAHIIASELEGATVANIKRKEMDADRMAASMILHMADISSEAVRGSVRDVPNYNPTVPVILPKFLEQVL